MRKMVKGLAMGMAAAMLLGGCSSGKSPVDSGQTTKKTTTTTVSLVYSTTDSHTGTSTTGTKGTGGPTKGTRPPADGSGETQDQTKASTKIRTTTKITEPPPPPKWGVTINVAGLDDCYFSLNAANNEWNRQIRNQLSEIEERLNCKFKLNKYKTADDLSSNCIKAHNAKTKFADIMVAPLHLQKKLVAGKAIQNLNAIKGLDLTKSYWDQNARRDMQIYGKNFAAFTTLDGPSVNPNVIYFNKVLAQQIGSSDEELYKMVRDGKWTFSTMQQLSSKARKDIDGKPGYGDNDQYGFGGVNLRGDVSYSIFKAQGGYFTTLDKGNVVFVLDMASNIRALRGMQSWLLKDNSVYNPDKQDTDGSKTLKAFSEGRLLFMGESASAAENYRDMKNDWGILPYPAAEKGDPYISTVDWTAPCFSVPSQVKGDYLARAATVLDAIARQFDKIKDDKRAYNKSRIYRDSQTQEMLDIAGRGASIDFCQYGDLGEGGLTCIHYLFNSISNDPAIVVKSRKENAVASLNAFLKTVR